MSIKAKYILLSCLVCVVLLVDLITKAVFGDTEFFNVIPYLIDFETNNGNDGVAFGLLSGKKWLLIILTLSLIAVMIFFDIKFKQKGKVYTIGFAFLLGGAIGNLVDRICFGYVRDFIKFAFYPSFPTFNIADSFLCLGVVLICVHLLFLMPKDDGKKDI